MIFTATEIHTVNVERKYEITEENFNQHQGCEYSETFEGTWEEFQALSDDDLGEIIRYSDWFEEIDHYEDWISDRKGGYEIVYEKVEE
jgi:hypothetical protein